MCSMSIRTPPSILMRFEPVLEAIAVDNGVALDGHAARPFAVVIATLSSRTASARSPFSHRLTTLFGDFQQFRRGGGEASVGFLFVTRTVFVGIADFFHPVNFEGWDFFAVLRYVRAG